MGISVSVDGNDYKIKDIKQVLGLNNEMDIYLVVFDTKAVLLGESVYPDLEAYIDHNYVLKKREEECAVPEWYVKSMKKILYLLPKTHLIVLLKRDICKFIEMNN